MARILIVDDNEELYRTLTRLFAKIGDRLVWMPNGRAAIKYVKTKKVDLILLDVMLPDMEGTEVLRAIRRDATTAELPIVMYSAVADPEFRAHARQLGADDYWVKGSLDFEQMSEKIRYLLRTRARRAHGTRVGRTE